MEPTSYQPPQEATLPQVQESGFTRLALYILLGVFFLVPFFFVPSLSVPFQFTKTALILLGTLLALGLFIIGKLKEGALPVPLNLVVVSAWLLPIVYFSSALLSSIAPSISLMGQSFGTDTVFFITANVMLLTLLPLLAPSKQKILFAYIALLVAFALVALFQAVRLFAGPDVLSFGIFSTATTNLIGKWNDLGIFFGLTAILSLITLEGLTLRPLSQGILYVVLIVSVAFLAVVNFPSIWIVLGLFALAFFIYGILKNRFSFSESEQMVYDAEEEVPKPQRGGLSVVSLLVLVVAIIFVIFGSSLNTSISSFFGINQVEARPSWTSTVVVAQGTYEMSPILGSGPNTFSLQWSQYKPSAINESFFWNLSFNSGIGTIPSAFITTGIVGGFAWIIFLVLFLYSGIRSLLLRPVVDPFAYYLSLSSFVGALYLWIFAVIYIPNTVLFSLAFFFTGLFLASLRHQDAFRAPTLVFSLSPRLGFISVLALTVILILSIVGVYIVGKHYVAAAYSQRAAVAINVEGNVDKALSLLERARGFAPIDTYAQIEASIEAGRLNGILSDENTTNDEKRTQFQQTLARAIENAQAARDMNPANFQNWYLLGQIYQSVVPLQIQGAYENAKQTYEQALLRAPRNPAIYLSFAELEVLHGDTAKAREYIQQALEQKSNYTAAVFLLAQIQVNENQIPQAIQSVESATLLEPNNPVIFFQLGLLRYSQGDYQGSAQVLERAVALNPIYANARYFLGLSYYQVGRAADAITQFERVRETNPDNEEVQRIIANLRAGEPPLLGIAEGVEPQEREAPPIEGE